MCLCAYYKSVERKQEAGKEERKGGKNERRRDYG